MSNFPHRIRKLRCLVSTSSQEAFAIRQFLHDSWQDTLIPAFESAFDEIVNRDRVIHIPKLELHLKVSSFPELLEVLPELIQQQIYEQLPQAIWEEATVQNNQFATLLHYLQTGSVPWQVAHASTLEIAVDLKETWRQQQSQLINYLSEQPQTAPFYFRLLQLLPKSEYFAVINTLLDRFPLAWRTTITEFIRFVLDTKQRRLNSYTQCRILALTLSECLNQAQQYNLPEFSDILDSVLSQAAIERNAFIDLLPAPAALLFKPQPNSDSPKTSAVNPAPSIVPQELASNPDTILLNSESLGIFTGESSVADLPERIESPAKDCLLHPAVCFEPSQEFPLFVNYAGLVLIHPFISSFFEATGIKETNSKVIADAQIAGAAALLHFLATEQVELYEYELGLIKILLGLEPETPLLVGEGLIQQSAREEAEAVLQSVINYWNVLKTTSIQGLRSSFLQRSGLLHKTENGWSLQVEHQSFDMLLEHLPWSISIIKLSWMKQPLYTEWQTF